MSDAQRQRVRAAIAEAVDAEAFAQAVAEGEEPVLLRAAVSDWALCRAAAASDAAVADYLRRHDTGEPVFTIVGQPSIAGRFGYSADYLSLNHQGRLSPISAVLPYLLPAGAAASHAIAIQAAPLRQVIRHWDRDNPMKFLPAEVAPTLWVSNPARVAPHSDIHDNIACVAAGCRHFILFPPEQIENLYLGPLLNAPGGVPVSTVNAWSPDFDRHPRFAAAHAAAQEALLQPGDALFIPALWWHAVESRNSLNILVNFWWGGTGVAGLSPYDALSHAILAISALPLEKRRRWRSYFDELVIRDGEAPAAHLPANLEDLISSPSDDQVQALLARLASVLSPDRR